MWRTTISGPITKNKPYGPNSHDCWDLLNTHATIIAKMLAPRSYQMTPRVFRLQTSLKRRPDVSATAKLTAVELIAKYTAAKTKKRARSPCTSLRGTDWSDGRYAGGKCPPKRRYTRTAAVTDKTR